MTTKAYFAGGCFWGMEELFRKLPGVLDTEVGYSGGMNENPTYKNHPGHAEALEVSYLPDQISHKELVDFFFRIHNPTTLNKQGNDIGSSYRSTIFYQDDIEKKNAEELIPLVDVSGRWPSKVVTTLEPFKKFWPAEPNHQDYLQHNPGGYTCHAIKFDSYLS
jgi:peptide-methionine (S)-S-oxide reductase